DRCAVPRVAAQVKPRPADRGEADQPTDVPEVGVAHVNAPDSGRSLARGRMALRRGAGRIDERLDRPCHFDAGGSAAGRRELQAAVLRGVVAGGDVDATGTPAADDGV